MRRRAALATGSVVIPRNADPLDRAKYELCWVFVDYLLDSGLSQKELTA